MFRKLGIVLLAVMFIGSMSIAPLIHTVNAADSAAKCDCAKGCKCEHCTTGKGECQCKGDGKDGCTCAKGCKCEHCMTGKGECQCKGHGKGGCACGKGCKCEHCTTGKGECQCKGDGKGGCTCGKGCRCEHCMTGKGECQCKGHGKSGCKCGKDCKGDCGHGAAPQATRPTSDADYAKTMDSKARTFRATYASDPEAIPINKMMIWKLKVETADGKPVADAKISVDGAMPEHGHGLPTQPKVTKNLGDGTYLVEGIKFSMPGWWTVTFAIEAGGKKDSVTFNLTLK